MISHDLLNIVHNLIQDSIYLVIPLIVYLIKMYKNPSKIEAEVLLRLLLPIATIIIKKLSEWHTTHPTYSENLNKAKTEVFNLRSKVGRKALG